MPHQGTDDADDGLECRSSDPIGQHRKRVRALDELLDVDHHHEPRTPSTYGLTARELHQERDHLLTTGHREPRRPPAPWQREEVDETLVDPEGDQ